MTTFILFNLIITGILVIYVAYYGIIKHDMTIFFPSAAIFTCQVLIAYCLLAMSIPFGNTINSEIPIEELEIVKTNSLVIVMQGNIQLCSFSDAETYNKKTYTVLNVKQDTNAYNQPLNPKSYTLK